MNNGIYYKTKTFRAIEARALAFNVASGRRTVGKGGRRKRRLLIRLAMEHGMYCQHCGTSLKFAWDPGVKMKQDNLATYDHRKTKKGGGGHTFDNGILSCRLCNELRGHQKVKTYLAKLKQYGSPQALRDVVRARTQHRQDARQDRIIKDRLQRQARAAAIKQARLCPFLRVVSQVRSWLATLSIYASNIGLA